MSLVLGLSVENWSSSIIIQLVHKPSGYRLHYVLLGMLYIRNIGSFGYMVYPSLIYIYIYDAYDGYACRFGLGLTVD